MPRASCIRIRCASAELFSAAKWTCPRDCHGLARRQVRAGHLLASHAARRRPLDCWFRPLRLNATDSPGSVNPGLTCSFRHNCRSGAYGAPVSFPAYDRREPFVNNSFPSRTVCRHTGSRPVSSAGSKGVRARGSVLQD